MTELPELIAYIDDDETMLEMARAIIEGAGRNTLLLTYQNGHDFIENAVKSRPALILLDLKMPEINGPDTLALLRKDPDTQNIPVIFVTGVKDILMTLEYKKLGVIGIIHKPFKAESFINSITNLWMLNKKDDSTTVKIDGV